MNFDAKATEIVRNYIVEHLDKSDPMPDFTVFTVWKCKALQNWKYLLSSTLFDGMYYELTYNGDKKEWYLDAYKKFQNVVVKEDGEARFGDVKRSDCFGGEDDSTVPADWIDQGHKIFKCSNCGNYLDFGGVNAGRGTANYCPNCGAKMWNILTRKPQKSKAMLFKKMSKSELTKREEEIRNYIANEYREALYAVKVDNTPETLAREDEASKILGKIFDILGYIEEKDCGGIVGGK